MVLTCGSMPAKASMPHVRHRNVGYAKSVAGSGKLGFSQAISDVSLCNKKAKTVHRYNPDRTIPARRTCLIGLA